MTNSIDSQDAPQRAQNPRSKKKREPQKRRPSLRKALSGKELDDDEFEAAIHEFTHGSDRVAAIMGATFVETHLSELISYSLVDASDKRALFDDPGAPFATFKSRIVAAKAMGLIDSKMAGDMDIIRDIRNQFAHGLLSFDFTHEAVTAACEAMTDHSNNAVNEREVSWQRFRFENACTLISALLLKKTNDILTERNRKMSLEHLMAKQAEEILRNPNGVVMNALFGATNRGNSG